MAVGGDHRGEQGGASPIEGEGYGAEADVGDGGGLRRGPHAEVGKQVKAREPDTDHCPGGVHGVQAAGGAAAFVVLHEPHEHWQRGAHAGGRQQEHHANHEELEHAEADHAGVHGTEKAQIERLHPA